METERVCVNCGNIIDKGRYCKKCGASTRKAVKTVFGRKEILIIYGPPPRQAEVVCANCGKKWMEPEDSWDLTDDVLRIFCPYCGKPNEIKPDQWEGQPW